MPHDFWGVKFPLFQESLVKGKTLKTPAPQIIQTEGALYWPEEALPFARSTALVQIVLQHSREAKAAYHEAINALELPGCQDLLNEAELKAPKTKKWSIKMIKRLLEDKVIRKPPWIKAINQFKDNEDVIQFFECIREFIRVGFNNQADREKEQYKVLAEKAPYLFSATVIGLIAEYCKVKLEDLRKYRPDNNAHMMNSNPTQRSERLRKQNLIRTYKNYKWVLCHDNILRKYADQWYKCRMNPGSIEAYLNQAAPLSEKGLERSNVSKAIAPFDEATGYPRKWRK